MLLQNVKVAFEKSFKNPVLRLFLRAIKWKKKKKTFSFPNVEQIRPNRKGRETHIRLKFYILNNSLDVVKTTTTFRNKKRERERNVCLFASLRGLAEWAQKNHVTLAIAPRLSPSAFGWTVIDKTGIETPLHLAEFQSSVSGMVQHMIRLLDSHFNCPIPLSSDTLLPIALNTEYIEELDINVAHPGFARSHIQFQISRSLSIPNSMVLIFILFFFYFQVRRS